MSKFLAEEGDVVFPEESGEKRPGGADALARELADLSARLGAGTITPEQCRGALARLAAGPAK